MGKQPLHKLDIEIDKLTHSIQNSISGDSFMTHVLGVVKADYKNITVEKGWKFDWKMESELENREIFKLVIEGNINIIQGLASVSDFKDHYYLHLVESAPFNLGKQKLYEGVPRNLFAFACKCSWDKGYQGFVSFQSKTKLIEHYEKTLGAVHIGGHKMVIFPHEALKLIKKYFLNK
jgi:hypothetical protein